MRLGSRIGLHRGEARAACSISPHTSGGAPIAVPSPSATGDRTVCFPDLAAKVRG
jgi:hypothetical protein